MSSGPGHARARDCLQKAATQVFSNLAHGDPDFNFKRILQAEDPDAAGNYDEAISPYVEELLRQFIRLPGEGAPATGSSQTTV